MFEPTVSLGLLLFVSAQLIANECYLEALPTLSLAQMISREVVPDAPAYAKATLMKADAAARIGRLYYGAADPKSGGVAQGARVFTHPQCHHAPEVYDGINADAAETLLKDFFAARRA